MKKPTPPTTPEPAERLEKSGQKRSKTKAAAPAAATSRQPKPGPPPGRPFKLDADMVKKIATAKQAGLPDNQAAAFCGLHRSTLSGWKARGEEHVAAGLDTIEASLIDAIEKARADFLATSLLRIQAAGKGGATVEEKITRTTAPDGTMTENIVRKVARPEWTADAWLAERSYPDDFGRTVQRVEHTGADGGPVKIDTWAGLAVLAERGAAK